MARGRSDAASRESDLVSFPCAGAGSVMEPNKCATIAEGSSVDDFPNLARLASRQQFLNKWYKPVALAPFAVVLFVIFKFFPESNSGVLLAGVFASLIWAMFVAGYGFYLIFGLKCPVCAARYGLGQKCRSCDLPRHWRESSGARAASGRIP
jgi:hypothetical protein